VARTITHTQEVIYIKQGTLKASIYDIDGRFLECIEAHQGDVLILLNGGHGYEIMEDATQVLEVKNGPFVGCEADKTRL
jgi:hypothetical protein